MKTRYKTLVLGSGVGGLGAGCWLKSKHSDFAVIERAKEIPLNLHNGVHYLHSIPELPFEPKLKKVTLTDGVLTSDKRIRHKPELQDALQYSEKIRSVQHPSSIYEVGKRNYVFVPKSNNMNDFITEMVDYIGEENFILGCEITEINLKEKSVRVSTKEGNLKIFFDDIVSTIPLGKFLEMSGDKTFEDMKFCCTPINILNIKAEKIVPNWLINIYVPSLKQKVYRMSILNNNASIESVDKILETELDQIKELFDMFHLNVKEFHSYTWEQGKILSIDIDSREKIINHFISYGVFLVGRFGLWNNKLLIDSTINQTEQVCKYIGLVNKNKEEAKMLVNFLL